MKRQCKHLAVFLDLSFLWLSLSARHEWIWVSTEAILLDITQPLQSRPAQKLSDENTKALVC